MVDIAVEDLGVRVANMELRKQPDPEKHSGFLITISTNYRPKTKEEAKECGEKLRKAVKAMLSDETNLAKIVKFLPPHEDDRWGPDKIIRVTSQFVIERGRDKRGQRIHSHAVLQIDHRSKIHLDKQGIKDVILPEMAGGCTCNIKNLYINIKYIRNGRGIRDYLTKEH